MHSSGHRDILLAPAAGMALATGVVCQAGEMTVVANILVRDGQSSGTVAILLVRARDVRCLRPEPGAGM